MFIKNIKKYFKIKYIEHNVALDKQELSETEC